MAGRLSAALGHLTSGARDVFFDWRERTHITACTMTVKRGIEFLLAHVEDSSLLLVTTVADGKAFHPLLEEI